MKKPIPTFESNKAAQDFVDTANLADYDLSGGTPVQFEFAPKSDSAAPSTRLSPTCGRG